MGSRTAGQPVRGKEGGTMMEEFMKQCCDESGRPDFAKMKRFMEKFGAEEMSGEQMAMMKRFCEGGKMPDMGRMMQFMKECGCEFPGEKGPGKASAA